LSDTQPAPGAAAKSSGGDTQGRAEGGGDPRLAAIVFALLVLACFAALIVTQRLKHTPTLVQNFKMPYSFAPTSGGTHREEAISFKLAKADEVTVTIIDASGAQVATLLRDLPVSRYKQLSLRWNGHVGEAHGYSAITSASGHRFLLPRKRGGLAPAGDYQQRVALRTHKRPVPSPRVFKLVAP
jgi:hypothetical protein